MPISLKSLARIVLGVSLITVIYVSFAAPHNGFDISDALIDSDQILAGGPAKDGIPAIDNPKFVKAKEARHMQPQDRILGVSINGISKAYPIGILNWHEIVNDDIRGQHFAVTYCPLCGTGVVFDAELNDQKLDFGVSGLLYNSDVLLYDRQTESLWSQIMSKAVTGAYKGSKLKRLPIEHTNWADWKQQHPDTLVLSDDTGYSRDYRRNPYSGYEESRALYFQVSNQAPAYFHPKERVLGLEVGDQYKAYPFSEIDKTGQSIIKDTFAGKQVALHWDKENQQATLKDAAGNRIAAIEGFWFAWFAFHPETEVYRAIN
ncbi:MAG: DUF3179 domain-containing protein [Gammaproteobacteria bacterium]|nr:DUF3179 domain-containing protein [Gammaproteobacteria bacterium]